jgi:hypothetical protein
MEFGNFGQNLIRVDQGVEKVTEPEPLRELTRECLNWNVLPQMIVVHRRSSVGVLPAELSGVTKLVMSSCR